MSDSVHGFDEKTALREQLADHGEIALSYSQKNMAQIINDGAVRKITTYALEHADEEGIRTSPII